MSFYKKYGERYNFDRVMPDHRYVPDVNSKNRIPFTHKNYIHALKYLIVNSAKKNPQIWLSIGVPIILVAAFNIGNYVTGRPNSTDLGRSRLMADYRYLMDSKKKELGAWNSHLNCFENDPWCNRDQQ